jgi:hypothetical protein
MPQTICGNYLNIFKGLGVFLGMDTTCFRAEHHFSSGTVYFRECLAIPGGLEPPTNSLEGCCSIQLSYGTSAEAFI